jgi:uncharacterized protein with GYD domain
MLFTYLGLTELTSEGRENLAKTPEYLDKIRHIIQEEGGRVLAKIAKLDVVKTETFPAEKVDVFLKALV